MVLAVADVPILIAEVSDNEFAETPILIAPASSASNVIEEPEISNVPCDPEMRLFIDPPNSIEPDTPTTLVVGW